MRKLKVHLLLIKRAYFSAIKKIYQNENYFVHALNIDILNKWLEFVNDRVSRFRDIVGTDFENMVLRKTSFKFYLLRLK